MKKRLFWLLAFGLLLLWAWHQPWSKTAVGNNDFRAFYIGSQFAFTPDLYHPPAYEKRQMELFGAALDTWLFVRPPFYAALLSGLGAMPYRAAYWLWQAVMLGALGWFVWRFRGEFPDLPWLALVSIPYQALITNGQDAALMLGLVGAGVALIRSGRPVAGGLVMSLLACKFHLFVFVPVALLAARAWKVVLGGAAGVGVLLGISFAAQGFGWPERYVNLLRNSPVHPEHYTLPNLRGALLALGATAWEWPVTAVCVLLVVVAIVRAKTGWEGKVGIALAGGLLMSRHGYISDALLLMGVVVLAKDLTATRGIVWALLLPPFYFLLLADGAIGAVFALLLVAAIGAAAMSGRAASEGGTATPQTPGANNR